MPPGAALSAFPGVLAEGKYRVVSERYGLVWSGDNADEAERAAVVVAVNTGRTVSLHSDEN